MDVRKKLIEILRKPIFPHELVDPTEAVADYLLDNGVTVQEWISIEDRLPEPWKQVLIYSRHDFCESAVYIGIPGKWRVTWNHEMLDADSVTHWMPLPSTEGLE